jgi:hypothetical protein
MVYFFLTSAFITKPVTTKIVLQFIYIRRIETTNHPRLAASNYNYFSKECNCNIFEILAVTLLLTR